MFTQSGYNKCNIPLFLFHFIVCLFFLNKKIVHLAAYTPEEQFDQYVIPVMNLNPAARQRHQLRIITVGFFRMLKCTLTNKGNIFT